MMTIHLNRSGFTFLSYEIDDVIQPDCIEVPVIRKALTEVLGIYKTEGLALYSEDWGVIAPARLGNGILSLILLYYYSQGKYNRLISNACMGRNIGPYLRELSKSYDFDIAWDCYLFMGYDEEIEARDFDTGTVFKTAEEVSNFYSGKTGVYDV